MVMMTIILMMMNDDDDIDNDDDHDDDIYNDDDHEYDVIISINVNTAMLVSVIFIFPSISLYINLYIQPTINPPI
jgi:hypothetical protein